MVAAVRPSVRVGVAGGRDGVMGGVPALVSKGVRFVDPSRAVLVASLLAGVVGVGGVQG